VGEGGRGGEVHRVHLPLILVTWFLESSELYLYTVKTVRSIILKKVDPGSGLSLKDHGYFGESNLEIGKGTGDSRKYP